MFHEGLTFTSVILRTRDRLRVGFGPLNALVAMECALLDVRSERHLPVTFRELSWVFPSLYRYFYAVAGKCDVCTSRTGTYGVTYIFLKKLWCFAVMKETMLREIGHVGMPLRPMTPIMWWSFFIYIYAKSELDIFLIYTYIFNISLQDNGYGVVFSFEK